MLKSPIIVLSGTNRPGANTQHVAQHVLGLLNRRLANSETVQPLLLDLQQLHPDIFSPRSYAEKPGWFVEQFQRPISNAKGMVVVTPEYNGGFPGVLKYFIDMLEFPQSLAGVPCVFIGLSAGQFGALRAIDQLSALFSYRRAHIVGERLYMPDINSVLAPDKNSGEWTVGPYEERLQKLLDALLHYMK
jgi:chromate reductase, NAD(P)H dehydrogenase (quinone)